MDGTLRNYPPASMNRLGAWDRHAKWYRDVVLGVVVGTILIVFGLAIGAYIDREAVSQSAKLFALGCGCGYLGSLADRMTK